MARKSKGPWFWKKRGEYVVNVHGRRYYLGADKDEADRQYHELMSLPPEQHKRKPKARVFPEFLAWCKRYRPDSYEWYRSRVEEFAATVPGMSVNDLKPFHVQEWIDTKKSDGHKRGCLIAVSRALNWAVKQGLIPANPIRFMEKPAAGRREVILSQKEFDTLLSKASDQQFRDLLEFLWESGARPQEAFRLEAKHLELKKKRCIFHEKESKGKKKKRVVYLTEKALEIVARLAAEYPTGKLFRNADGNPWHRNNVACRFARASEKLGTKYCLYNLRHSYCQRALKNGVDPITLSELMGHSSAAMIMRIYQHLNQDADHMLEAAVKAAKS